MAKQLFVATRKGLFTLDKSATGDWKIGPVAFLGSPVTSVLLDPRDNTRYAALNLGHFGVKLHRSDSGSSEWTEVAVPLYPPKPDDETAKETEAGKVTKWSLVQIWSLESAGADQPNALWAGTIPGGLFRSDDRGNSWQLVRSLWDRPERRSWFGGGYDDAGIHSVCVDPRDTTHVTLAVSCGGVWTTHDNGQSWVVTSLGMYAEYMPPEKREDPAIQDPHRLVACPTNPDAMWVQHHNGIFRSVNGAKSWQAVPNAKPSVFGFAVAVHPKNPETAWFVPAVKDEFRVPVDGSLVVSRTRDGGKSFEILTRGLPQQNAYHLVYRHCLDVDSTGDILALGSTTGGLWISEDQGDNWSLISNDLPPIYAVRFAETAT